MVHWSCSCSLCFNNHKTTNEHGEKLKYYKLPQNNKIQTQYKRLFKTDGFNWKKGYICGAHWKDGVRITSEQLPEIIVPKPQLDLLKLKFKRAKDAHNSAKKPSPAQILRLKKAKRKLSAALSLSKEEVPVIRKVYEVCILISIQNPCT